MDEWINEWIICIFQPMDEFIHGLDGLYILDGCVDE